MEIHESLASAQFENLNSLREYPFADGSSRRARDGRELPQDVIVDVHLLVPASFENPESWLSGASLPDVRLSSVHLSQQMVSACFVSEFHGVRSALSVSVARASFRPYFPYRLEKLVGTEDCGGVVTFGDIAFPSSPETYLMEDAAIHPCCCAIARPPALRRFFDERSGDSVSGDAEIAFSGYILTKRDGKSFSLSLEKGADAELASDCANVAGLDVCGATPIRSINGVSPDADGNIVLWFH